MLCGQISLARVILLVCVSVFVVVLSAALESMRPTIPNKTNKPPREGSFAACRAFLPNPNHETRRIIGTTLNDSHKYRIIA